LLAGSYEDKKVFLMISREQLQSAHILSVFQKSIADWHKEEKPYPNPYKEGSFEAILYEKNHTDTIQWHIEDEIRRPDLPLEEIVRLKRMIDKLNQKRTDLVELIDDFIQELLTHVVPREDAKLNSESPAWLIDRMSILELKIWHMKEQTERVDVDANHLQKSQERLRVLLEQRQDLSQCLDELIADYLLGIKKFKVYRQMKMYNDKETNPALYKSK